MKIKYKGVFATDEWFQAVFQDRETIFRTRNIAHIKNATLYFTTCDEQGEEVVVRDGRGGIIDGFMSAGAYRSVADYYEEKEVEPTVLPFVP